GLGDVNSGRLLNVQVFTSSALYTPTPGTKKAIVEVQGAGGAGAGTNSPATMCAASGSGTSGAYAKAIIDNPTPQQITVGSGGKGGVNNPAGNGNAGGQSSFGSLVTAIGGLGGEAMTAGTGVWSAFFSGTMPAIQFTGASISGRGCGMPTISLRLGGVFSYSGNGGDSIFGAGGIGSRGQSRGGDGVGYGAGGAGANVNGGIAGSFTGGDGADGVVIVWEYM
ncbi:carbohydrate kinase, partial [Kluyvera cryocrescens]|uniref:carbohydrate kinase n=1 Tax=Kluyvera cryocrescens TaxID=580 RepID=UPI000AEA7792